MKLSILALLATIGSAVKTSPKRLREDRDLRSTSSGKSGDLNCLDCFQELPGYSFFGENFEEKDFYENLLTYAFGGRDFEEAFDRDDGPTFGVDYFVPGPFGLSTGGATCYDVPIICGVLTFLSEIIYTSDLLNCFLVNIVALLRSDVCEDITIGSGSTAPVPSLVDSFLKGDLKAVGLSDITSIYTMIGAPDLSAFMPAERRKLHEEKPRELQIRDGVAFLIDILDNIPDSFVTTLADNLFFVRCQLEGQSPGTCALLFTLLKTLDASVCYYRDVLGCGEETCGKDTMFDIGYETDRLAINLPFVGPEVAVVAAPCDNCLLSKTDGCSAFCSLYQSYHQCQDIAPVLSFFETSGVTPRVPPAVGYSFIPGYNESIAASGSERFP